jgi:hypothetical protein
MESATSPTQPSFELTYVLNLHFDLLQLLHLNSNSKNWVYKSTQSAVANKTKQKQFPTWFDSHIDVSHTQVGDVSHL